MSKSLISLDGWPLHLCVSFRTLRNHGACTDGYRKVAQFVRDNFAVTPEDFGMDHPIPLALILKSNNLADTLWSFRATLENSDRFARLLACDYAERVLPIFEKRYPDDKRPRECIRIARLFAVGQATDEERIKARRDAYAAAAYAYDAAAYAAAYAAADAAAYAAAYAADDAAYARLTEKQWQSDHLDTLLWAAREGGAATALESCAALTGGAPA